MKRTFLSTVAFLLLSLSNASAQIGNPFEVDVCNDLLFSQWDGSFISCGSKGASGSIYKTDCTGAIIAELVINNSPISTTFWGAVELEDGSVVAVGSAFVASAIDTVEEVTLLKATPDLSTYLVTSFRILNKASRAKAITLSKNGHLLLIGEVAGDSTDFTDMFFQRVSPATLLPTAAPVIFNYGVDLAAKIMPLADEFFLITGSNFVGNIFDPVAPITNRLIAIKIDDTGNALWTYEYEKVFLATIGVSQSGGGAQNAISGNIMISGNTAGDSTGLDAVMILLSNNGVALDTVTSALPESQFCSNTLPYSNIPGLFIAVGGSDNPAVGAPNLFAYQVYEFNNEIAQENPINDPTQVFSIPDIVEYETDRFAFAISFPDNSTFLAATDYFVITPVLEVQTVYENCVLFAIGTDNSGDLTPALSYQWYLNGAPIPGSKADQLLPETSGDYYVVVTDAAGCSAISDTVHVNFLSASFSYTSNALTYVFLNSSEEADTYLWDFGDGLTSTQVNPVHTYSIPGVYTVTLTVTNDCGEKTATQVITIISPANEPSWLSSFSLAPNPGNGLFTVDMSGQAQDILEFVLYGPTGQKVHTEQVGFQAGTLRKSFDFSGLSAGVYTLQVRAQGEVKYVRVVMVR